MGLTRAQKSHRARAAKARRTRHPSHESTTQSDSDPEIDDSICDWDGTINHYVMDISDEDSNNSSDSEWSSESRESDEESDEEWDLESEGNCVVLERMRAEAAQELAKLLEPSATEELMKPKTDKEWKEAGKSMRGVYTGSSARTQRRKDKELRDKETKDAVE
ncbi:hypothetical protein AAF712_016739 [Marasmius tenuissimus]|uniref:Uncharacterized protein n=1 Tax=Marasmius tenuissimus TaxID=585030 RepID=A0ABR2Z535_9AGAR